MRLLLSFFLLIALVACGESGAGPEDGGDRSGDVAFATELMHRDAALLNLLDAGLGRSFDPAVTAATDQLRVETVQRLETSADLLESWDAEVPVTVRDHSIGHGPDAEAHSSDLDVPSLDGMTTGDDLQALGEARGSAFESEFVRLLEESLSATRSVAEGFEAADGGAGDLATEASSSCASALDAI